MHSIDTSSVALDEPDAVTMPGDSDIMKYRHWTIALGVTSAVFLVTTLLLACILFVVVCRKIAKLRKERETRVTGVMEGEWQATTVTLYY